MAALKILGVMVALAVIVGLGASALHPPYEDVRRRRKWKRFD